MNTRSSRKQFLIAASELSRLRLIEDFSSLSEGFHRLTGSAGSFKAVASSAALLVTGLAAFQPERQKTAPGKASWLKTLLHGVGLASTVWLALQAPRLPR